MRWHLQENFRLIDWFYGLDLAVGHQRYYISQGGRCLPVSTTTSLLSTIFSGIELGNLIISLGFSGG